MADLEKEVRTRLLAHAGVSQKVGTGKRVWYSELPEDPTFPALTVQEISSVPESLFGDDAGVVDGTVQVDAWDDSRAGAKALGEQVRDALQRWRGTPDASELKFVGMEASGVRQDPAGSGIWRQRQDFRVWFTESVT